jgi:hypothetical protein
MNACRTPTGPNTFVSKTVRMSLAVASPGPTRPPLMPAFVDEHVQRADGLSCGRHGRVVGHVELHEPCADRIGGLPAARAIACADPDIVAGGGQLPSGLEAQALVRSGETCRVMSDTIRDSRRPGNRQSVP